HIFQRNRSTAWRLDLHILQIANRTALILRVNERNIHLVAFFAVLGHGLSGKLQLDLALELLLIEAVCSSLFLIDVYSHLRNAFRCNGFSVLYTLDRIALTSVFFVHIS